jgi:hypothetical protein
MLSHASVASLEEQAVQKAVLCFDVTSLERHVTFAVQQFQAGRLQFSGSQNHAAPFHAALSSPADFLRSEILQRACRQLFMGQQDQAVGLLEQVWNQCSSAARLPERIEAGWRLAEAYQSGGQTALSLQVSQQVISLELTHSETGPRTCSPWYALQIAQTLQQEGDFDQAVVRLEALARCSPCVEIQAEACRDLAPLSQTVPGTGHWFDWQKNACLKFLQCGHLWKALHSLEYLAENLLAHSRWTEAIASLRLANELAICMKLRTRIALLRQLRQQLQAKVDMLNFATLLN